MNVAALVSVWTQTVITLETYSIKTSREEAEQIYAFLRFHTNQLFGGYPSVNLRQWKIVNVIGHGS